MLSPAIRKVPTPRRAQRPIDEPILALFLAIRAKHRLSVAAAAAAALGRYRPIRRRGRVEEDRRRSGRDGR